MKIIIGIGNKARNGKDTLATYLQTMLPNAHIIHFADQLYSQVENSDLQRPLAIQTPLNTTQTGYFLRDDFNDPHSYKLFLNEEVPALHELYINPKDNIHMTGSLLWQMKSKAPELLQFWGTDYRRRLCSENYWIDRTNETIETIHNTYDPKELVYFLLPDTRFQNEYDFVTQQDFGYYVKIKRMNPDGSQYIDPFRDSKHESEVGLDEIASDYTIIADTGDLDTIKSEAEKFVDFLQTAI